MDDRARRRAGASSALLGASVGLLVTALASTLSPRVPFPPLSVAQRVANLTPGGIATFFIEALQHLALPLTVVVTMVLFVVGTLWLGRRLPWLATRAGVLGAAMVLAVPFIVIGAAAYRPDPSTVGRAVYAAVVAVGAAVGATVTAWSYRRLADRGRLFEHAQAPGRRLALQAAGLGIAAMLLGWGRVGRALFPRADPGRMALDVRPARPAPEPEPEPTFESIEGLSPLVTANDDFYVVDEELVDPDVDSVTWRLAVGGMVDAPFELGHDELLALPLVERYSTLECISNPIGGDLMSTAKWTGVPLPDLLERAGARHGALEVVFRAVGGYSDSLPIDDALRPETMIVLGMNGNVLPREHGYPARLLAPGYYGMKQPKWLESIEVVDRPYTGYWERRGWIKAAIVQTGSRVDAVQEGEGSWVVAGVAFAGDRGIARVECSLDAGATWLTAELEPPLSGLTWRRWKLPIAAGGADEVLVRATDGAGAVQTSAVAPPHPSGATGYDGATL